FFGELRTKAIKVSIKGNELTVTNYLGLGTTTVYDIGQFDGLETSILPSEYSSYEYLYLMEKGKKTVKISQFYHSNYKNLKVRLMKQTQNLGHKDYNLIQEIKEIFI
ncbi:MAG: hypothetical protein H7Y31_12050, partial [Chitinophagaceae bacterium]|nr:hypothetical protein [Chitinophagaceae bacterium]